MPHFPAIHSQARDVQHCSGLSKIEFSRRLDFGRTGTPHPCRSALSFHLRLLIITLNGRTVGIITLASFTPQRCLCILEGGGAERRSHRVEVINVDGGPGAPGDLSGSFETTLDVEQSGGATGDRIAFRHTVRLNDIPFAVTRMILLVGRS
jgi:hypothetical protein